MKQCKIVFIGGGNMAGSLIGGMLVEDCKSENIAVVDLDQEKLDDLQQRYQVNTTTHAADVLAGADVIVLAVKPQVMKGVVEGIMPSVTGQPLFVSVAAGIREESLANWIGKGHAIVRCMPNTPSLVQSGATALYANDNVNEEQRDVAESVMRSVGLVIWLEHEKQMDAVTALSGSGPAYFFLVMEVMQKAAEELGLPGETARLLCLQTAFGASKMALESNEDAAELRRRVTSPGGTTEQGINTLVEGDIEGLFAKALQAASKRSEELAEMLGES